MSREGRINGRVNGAAYELWQGKTLVQSIPLAQAHADEKFKRAIARNCWGPLT